MRNFRLIAALTLTLLASAAGAYAQDGRINIGKKKASAGEVMNLIENQGRYRFTYNRNDLDTARIHTFPRAELSIKDALYFIIKDSGLGYVVRNKHIAFIPVGAPTSVITSKPVQEAPSGNTRTPVNTKIREAASEGRIWLPIEAKATDWTEAVVPITILFRFDSDIVDSEFMNNAASLRRLHAILTNGELLPRLDSIVIHAHSSPDGSPRHNENLSVRRAGSLENYILRNYPHINRSVIWTYAQLEGYWDKLLKIVDENPHIPGRYELKSLIENPYMSDAEKSARFNHINDGKTFAYLRDNFYLRSIRTGTTINFFYAPQEPRPAPTQPAPIPAPVPIPEAAVVPQVVEPVPQVVEPVTVVPVPVPIAEPAVPQPVAEPAAIPEQVAVQEPQPMPEPAAEKRERVSRTVKIPPIAFRTNLLLDAVGGANLGIEIPIGQHFSLSGDFAYAYTRVNNLYAFQTKQGTLEARYWFKPRRNAITGWNLGVYGTYCDRFDIQWGAGVQGDGFWSGGLSCGYSFPLSDSFNLDLSAMGGFVYSPRVREYGRPQDGNLMWERTRYNVSRVSLTMVRVNLVWLINKKEAK